MRNGAKSIMFIKEIASVNKMFKAKIYKLGRSGRLAIMLPKDVILEPGEYEVEIKKPESEAVCSTAPSEGIAVEPPVVS